MAEFERNTTGFTADVEMYDDGTLAKIYRDEIPDENVQREILCTEFVQNKGLDVPEYRGAVVYNGKRAILLEYIRGESAMKELTVGDAEQSAFRRCAYGPGIRFRHAGKARAGKHVAGEL